MTFPTDDVSVTTTTLAVLLLPQPFSDTTPMAARQRPRKLDFLPTFVRTISPTKSRGADLALTLAFLTLTKSCFPLRKMPASPAASERPANSEAESRFGFEIIQSPRIILDVLEYGGYFQLI